MRFIIKESYDNTVFPPPPKSNFQPSFLGPFQNNNKGRSFARNHVSALNANITTHLHNATMGPGYTRDIVTTVIQRMHLQSV